MRHPVVDRDAVFTLASIGVEKLMKITLGLRHLQDQRVWPTTRLIMGWGTGF
jgi:hypothetical protein